jgi:hypothetical protein
MLWAPAYSSKARSKKNSGSASGAKCRRQEPQPSAADTTEVHSRRLAPRLLSELVGTRRKL